MVTDPERIWPTSSTARRTSGFSPAKATAADDTWTSDMTDSLPPCTDNG
ncbi:hypothetical protein I552_6753 [Mycobacterium xenopi 3993]|nr:hypothetical protein I552_6753 [Mycobacterium xenopi 3993]